MNRYSHRTPQFLVQETGSLISLPEVCLKLRAVLGDPDHTRRQVTDVIIHDPALTTRLLRIVNSAWFGLSTTVKDISHALAILGEQDLHNLVVVTSLVRGVRASLSPGFDLTPFWKRSVFGAVLARSLAEALDQEAKEELFICGLLLNVGKLPLYWREPELYRELTRRMRDGGGADWEIERELLGFDHAQVGAELARRWNFSEVLAQGIARHHEKPEPDAPLAYRIAAVAGSLCDLTDWEAAEEGAELPREMEDAGIAPEVLDETLRRGIRGTRQVYDTFFGSDHGA